jgi:hypothetical protein
MAARPRRAALDAGELARYVTVRYRTIGARKLA